VCSIHTRGTGNFSRLLIRVSDAMIAIAVAGFSDARQSVRSVIAKQEAARFPHRTASLTINGSAIPHSFDNPNNVTLTHEQLARLVREAGANNQPFAAKFNPAATAVANNPIKTMKGPRARLRSGCRRWGPSPVRLQ
jgi:hypothetical protein